jgi:WD40 repeat protein
MRIAANDVLGKITIWSLESAAPVAIGSIAFGEEWGDVSFSPDGSTLAVTASAIDDGLTLVDLRTHKKRSEFVSHGCRDFTWSPDGRYFAAAENHTNDVLVCNGSSGQLVWRLNGHTSSIESVAFSPDSRLLASVDDTRRILLWGVDHGSEIWSATDSSITNKRGSPDSLVFTPSGRTLMSLSSAGVIGAWHVATGRELFQLDDTMRASSCLTLCNEGRYICMWRVGRLCVLETGLPPESIADDAAPNIVSP